MPLNKFTKYYLAAGAVVILIGVYFMLPKSSPPSRFPSSAKLGKAHAPVMVELFGPSRNALPDFDDKEIIISARIHVLTDIQGELKYQWIVLDEKNVFDRDALSGEYIGVQAGQVITDLKLEVSGFAKNGPPSRVTLQVWSENGGAAATYAPYDEAFINEGVQLKSLENDKKPKIHQ